MENKFSVAISFGHDLGWIDYDGESKTATRCKKLQTGIDPSVEQHEGACGLEQTGGLCKKASQLLRKSHKS